jgi:hypothetical protein
MPRHPPRVLIKPAPPFVPRPPKRPSHDALLDGARVLVRSMGPPGEPRDIERTASLIADKLDACWDYYAEVDG